MTRAIRIGRLFGVDIEIDYTWFIVFFLVAALLATGWFSRQLPGISPGLRWLVGFATAALFFLSVLLHELSHSLVAIRSGLRISGITLFLFGGVSKMADEPKSARVEFLMAIAGPAASLLLAALFLLLSHLLRGAPGGHLLATVFQWLGLMNGSLAVFNLVPGFPLDGGRLLRAGLWAATHSLTESTRIASSFGQVIGFLMIVVGVLLALTHDLSALWLALIGWFLVQAAQQSYQHVIFRQSLLGVPVSSVMTTQVDWVPAAATLDQVVHEHVMVRSHPAFPVLDNTSLLGLLSLTDIRHVPQERWPYVTAAQVVPPLAEGQTIPPTADAWDALVSMGAGGFGRLLVTRDGALLGIISRTDVMRLLHRRMELGV